jgi:hypothetical protein
MTYFACRASMILGTSSLPAGAWIAPDCRRFGLPGAEIGPRAEDPTIAEMFKPLGYATGQFRKNHLGDRNEFLPTVQDTGPLNRLRIKTIDDDVAAPFDGFHRPTAIAISPPRWRSSMNSGWRTTGSWFTARTMVRPLASYWPAGATTSTAHIGGGGRHVMSHSAAVGRNQTKARVARGLAMSVSGWIRQQEGEPQTTQITQITQMARLPGQGARLEAMSLQPAFALFALFAVPLALRRCHRLRAMILEGYCQATQRVIGHLSENHHGLR